MAVLPVAVVYHLYWPAVPPFALRVMLAVPQDEFPVAVGTKGNVLMVAETDERAPSQMPLLMLT